MDKKIDIIGASSILFVAMVATVAVGTGQIGGDWSFSGGSDFGSGGISGDSSIGVGSSGEFEGHSSIDFGGEFDGHSSVGDVGQSSGSSVHKETGGHSSGGSVHKEISGHSSVGAGSNVEIGGHSSIGGESNGKIGGHSSIGGGSNGKSGGHSSVGGGGNAKSGGHSSVGGGGNSKSGGHSSIGGGDNEKSGGHSSVDGGGSGKSGGHSSVGGDGSGKSGGHSSVSGGGQSSGSGGGNGKSGGHSSVSGGGQSSGSGGGNGKSGGHSSVGGGGNGKSDGHSSVSGGGNGKSGGHSSVGGGGNGRSGGHSSVGGGGNGESGGHSSVGGGGNGKSGGHSSVGGGGNGKSGGHSSVSNGDNGKSGGRSSEGGGGNGKSDGHSSVGGGNNGKSGSHSSIGGGGNSNSGGHSSVGSGGNDKNDGHSSLGGGGNGKVGGHSSVGGGHTGKSSGHSSVDSGSNGKIRDHSMTRDSHNDKSDDHSSIGGSHNGKSGSHSSVGVGRNRKSGPNPKSGGIDGQWSAGFGSNQGSGGIGGQWSIGVGSNQEFGKIGGGSSGFLGFSAASTIVQQICQPTDYKEACAQTLSAACGSITDPRELIKIVFTLTVKHISEAISNSTVLKKVEKDLRISDAIDSCHELLDYSIGDLERSAERIVNIDLTKLAEHTHDLKTWLSGAITYQQTCLDGFENTTGIIGNEMRKLLAFSGELTSNGLAIVTELSKIFSLFKLGASGSFAASAQAKVLSSDLPEWSSSGQRRLLAATTTTVKPNVVVAKDGSGKYKTIGEALKEVQKKSNSTFVIYIKAGVYEEYISINRSMRGVYLLGDGPTKTKITGSRSYVGGYNTYRTPTVAVSGDFFMAKDIGFENTAGPQNHQAVALRVSSDRSVIYNCQIDGYQDTLYAHAHRQFYRDCTITGTVDFIFGDAAAVFQNCRLIVRKPLENQNCMVTAQGRKDKRGVTGLVLQNCTVTGSPEYLAARAGAEFKAFLGRPWKNYSRTVVMQSEIDAIIDPSGWAPWFGSVNLDTCWYAEFGNRGPGASKDKRVMWRGVQKVIMQDEVASFTPARFINGDSWIPATGVPYVSGMISV